MPLGEGRPRALRLHSLLPRIIRSSAIAVIADRTACSILTLFIVIATSQCIRGYFYNEMRYINLRFTFTYLLSRPQNKISVCCQSADPTITADLRPQSAVRTPLLHLQSQCRTVWPFTAPCHCWQTSRAFSTPSLSPIDTYGVSDFVFVVHFVAKRYILQQKC